MAIEDIRKMTLDQLDQQLGLLKKEQFNLRFQVASGQIENTGRIRQVRREIARVMTVAGEKRSGSTTGQPAGGRAKSAKTA